MLRDICKHMGRFPNIRDGGEKRVWHGSPVRQLGKDDTWSGTWKQSRGGRNPDRARVVRAP